MPQAAVLLYWTGMSDHIKTWTSKCLGCLSGRRRPTKQESVAVKPSGLEAWQEVMIDFEGPNPPDQYGNKYVLTYFCCLSHEVLLEPGACLSMEEVRRCFSRAMFRSRTLPLLIRSDRGQEFQSAIFTEYCDLMGI